MTNEKPDPTAPAESLPSGGLSRRNLLLGGGAFGGALLAGYTIGAGGQDELAVFPDHEESAHDSTEPPTSYNFFDEEEVRLLTALVARIIPGDDEDPGALQAGVMFYIDDKLHQFESFAEPTYHREPFAEEYEDGEQPPTGDDVVAVHGDELYRYGFQGTLAPQQLYRAGLSALDRYAQTRYGQPFDVLTSERQDAILTVLDDIGQANEPDPETDSTAEEMDLAEDSFGDANAGTFFSTVRTDCIEGMFADPEYGGNRGLVGWAMIGYPGAQRSYSPEELLNGTTKQPQSMHGLTPMNPDLPHEPGAGALEQHQHGVTEGRH